MLLILLVVLAGCESVRTTRALGSLQTEYGDLVRTEADCQRARKANEACLGDFPAIYASIEAEAVEAIEARRAEQALTEQQITIALYRLAAFAALKSKSGEAATYADSGLKLCGTVQVKPPRDCALLQVVGQYEVINQYAADVKCLIAGSPDCARSFEQAADQFCRDVYKPLLAKTKKAKSVPLLPDSVVAYLDAQPPRAVKSQQALASKLTDGLRSDALPTKPCDCVELNRLDPNFAQSCGNVTNEPMATFKAECVRRALENDKECPTFRLQ
jgi:hypothetical protein